MNNIIDYDSSSSSSDEETQIGMKRASSENQKESKRMPKLPSFFDTAVPKKTPLHQGRQRAVPHQQNSWATYVYLQVDLTGDKENILKYCPGLELIEEQHISLSKTVYLREHQLQPFVLAIKNLLSDTKPFTLSFAQIAQLTNEEKTRSFVTLEVGAGYNELSNCLNYVDTVMKQYNQPVFYDPPRFHTSIAWSLNESSINIPDIPQSCLDDMSTNTFVISKLYIKQGNRINHIDLK